MRIVWRMSDMRDGELVPLLTLGWRLKMALDMAHLSREHMAAALGVSPATITGDGVMTARWTDIDVAAEMLWVAREAQALSGQRQPSRPWTSEEVDAETRWAEYLFRKRAVLEYVEQERMSRA